MVLKVVLRLSWICLLLCGSGFSYPFPTNVQTGTGGGSTGGGDSVLGTYYGGGPSYFYGTGGAGYGSTAGGGGSGGKGSGSRGSGSAGSDTDDSAGPGFPVFQAFPWGHKFHVVPQVFNLNDLTLPEFLDNPWDGNDVPLGSVDVPLVPPSSHIVQTSNGYQRARSVLAHSKYSPDDWDVLPLPSGEDDEFPIKGQ
ncbi:probable peroxisomal membrane protein PEX13 [Salarias fasciatus]|uniref:probable peroxisomal membrane protein PEX13 n=1 Tax=Salarias fasciatus TaxID=181472 RepID=UPI001176C404|nr:probable peroxisomal membrane protein PEX13 [Salarias fasciatus]